MSEMKKINDEALEQVSGGATRRVQNDASSYSNLRWDPGLHTDVRAKLYNGDYVETTGRKVTKDGYTWYEVWVHGAEDLDGWIAGSLIGY